MAVMDREYDTTFPKITIKYKDPFDFAAVYQKLWYWCQNEGYDSKSHGGGASNYETFYRERRFPAMSELWCTWKMRKKLNAYIFHDMEVKMQILARTKVEVLKDGKKEKLDNGELVIEITGEIAFNEDFEKQWKEKKIFTKFPFNIIRKTFKIRTIKDILDYWEDRRFPKHFALANTLKEVLGIKI
jgi:hypothetical protein